MASSYTPLLGFVLPVTGELSGSWGSVWNDSGTSLLDSAISGTTSITADADITLTATTGTANQARQAIILWNPASGTATRNITAPAQSKIYTVINASGGTQSIVFRGAGPTTGVTIIKGESAVVAWNGTDFIKISNTGGGGSFTNVAISGTTTLSGLTASTALALDASKNVVSVTNTGTGNNVLATSPTLVTPALGTPTSVTLTNATGLPISTGVSGLGTGVATALAINVGSAGAPVLFNGALGTPSSGTVTNLTGTASININGTVGATTASTGAFTTLSASGDVTLSGATANGVVYANGSKVLTTGSALTFNGSVLGVNNAGDSDFKLTTNNTGSGSTDGLLLRINSTGTEAYLWNWENGALIFGTNAAEQMRLTSTGLGIGTSSPGAKLHVLTADGATTSITAGATGKLRVFGYADATRGALLDSINTAENTYLPLTINGSSLLLQTGATTRATLDSSGNLGLGVTPSAWTSSIKTLEIAGGGAVAFANPFGIVGSTNGFFNGTNWIYKTTGAAAEYLQAAGQHQWFTAPSGTAGNAISFTQAMTLDASGNLGIGTSSPSTKLHVAGAVVSGQGVMKIQDLGGSGTSAFPVISLYDAGGANQGNLGMFAGDQVVENKTASGKILFKTNSTTVATLDSSGNLGLGVTPSAWDSIIKPLETNNGVYFGGQTDSEPVLYTGANNYYGTGAFRYKLSSKAATRYQQDTGQHKWFNAPSGTAGAAISFTQAMTLDASGNLCIGTTTPTERLTVNGRIQSQWNNFVNGGATSYCGDATSLVTGASAGMWAARSDSALLFSISSTERARIDSSGNLIQTVNTTAATLATNNTLTFSIVDNSTLRISVRGSDGTTRTATVALT